MDRELGHSVWMTQNLHTLFHQGFSDSFILTASQLVSSFELNEKMIDWFLQDFFKSVSYMLGNMVDLYYTSNLTIFMQDFIFLNGSLI